MVKSSLHWAQTPEFAMNLFRRMGALGSLRGARFLGRNFWGRPPRVVAGRPFLCPPRDSLFGPSDPVGAASDRDLREPNPRFSVFPDAASGRFRLGFSERPVRCGRRERGESDMKCAVTCEDSQAQADRLSGLEPFGPARQTPAFLNVQNGRPR